ncbi:hypothetical protein MMC11_002244 [Xylographa trunciseda]|nr:hypothetical protein [Xylographa trunciseda]
MDPLNLAGVIGTWAAVGLALIALIGIVGPLLLLREQSSERHEALNSIDSQHTDYIRNGWKLLGKGRFFLKVGAPLLTESPNSKDHFCQTHLFTAANNVRLHADISKTGWVNLAATLEAYSSGISKGDSLIVRRKQAWLPVHRFWLLAFGLLGRYCERDDHGKAVANGNASRLMIEEDEDTNDAWGSSPSTMKLYGTTGTIWWRRRLDEFEMSIDEVYFIPHSKDDRQELYPDPIPLWQLSWLALGCLPLGPTKDHLVYDLTSFQPHYHSGRRNGEDPDGVFYSFEPRESFTQTGHHKRWAQAMGLDMKKLCCIQVTSPFDKLSAANEAKENRGPWFQLQEIEGSYVKRSDIHRQILGLLHLPVSPKGVLFDHRRYQGPSIFQVSAQKVSELLVSIHQERYLGTLLDDERAILAEMRDLWSSNERRYPRFSRKEAQASYNFDIALRDGRPSLPSWIRDIVGIITLTSDAFFASLASEWVGISSLEINVTAGCVRTTSGEGTVLEHTLNFAEVFGGDVTVAETIENRYDDRTAILLAALAACVRAFCFRSLWDSTKLIRLIQEMDEIALLAASSRIPVVPIKPNTETGSGRRRRVSFQADSSEEAPHRRRAVWGGAANPATDPSNIAFMPGVESNTEVSRSRPLAIPSAANSAADASNIPFMAGSESIAEARNPNEDMSDSSTLETGPHQFHAGDSENGEEREDSDLQHVLQTNVQVHSRRQRRPSSPLPMMPGSTEALPMEELQRVPRPRHLRMHPPIADEDELDLHRDSRISSPNPSISGSSDGTSARGADDTAERPARAEEDEDAPASPSRHERAHQGRLSPTLTINSDDYSDN